MFAPSDLNVEEIVYTVKVRKMNLAWLFKDGNNFMNLVKILQETIDNK